MARGGQSPVCFLAKSALRSLFKCAELVRNNENTLWLTWKKSAHWTGAAGMFGHANCLLQHDDCRAGQVRVRLRRIWAQAEASPRSSQDGEGLRAARPAAALDNMAEQFIDPGYDVSACAGHLGVSVRYLQVLLEAGGRQFSKELARLRLERAHDLLSDPLNAAVRVADIVYDCGFSDISHFNRQFRARFGGSPTSVRSTSSSAPSLEPSS